MKNLLVITAFVFSSAYCQTCNLKRSVVDWKKLEGTTWYQMLVSAPDSIDAAVPCFAVRFNQPTDYGTDVLFMSVPPQNPENIEYSNQRLIKYGWKYIFANEKNLEQKWFKKLEEEAKQQRFNDKEKLKEDLDIHYQDAVAIYTDYKTYHMGILSTPEKLHVYAAFPHNKLTAEDVLAVHNVLVENNCTAPLTMTKCETIDNIAFYVTSNMSNTY